MPKSFARRTLCVCSVFLVLGVGIHVFAPTLNGLKMFGLPAGYAIAAQGGPLLLAVLFVMWRSRKASA